MIELIPAIDIIGGKCVRLAKGDYDKKTEYNESPVDVAKAFQQMGFRRLHIVDLDGARSKHIVNSKILNDIASATSNKKWQVC
jgi:phosphoribosylformimino-5-aminoimidazole carboxamide ribotide isomerase